MLGTLDVLAGWLIDGSGAPAESRVLLHIEDGRIVTIERLSPAGTAHPGPEAAAASHPGRPTSTGPGSEGLPAHPAGRTRTQFPSALPDPPSPERHDQGNPRRQAATVPPCLDLSHFTILPGLVDSHVHLFMSGTADPQIRRTQLEAPFEISRRVISAHLRDHLCRGVLAVRDGGDRAGHTLRYKRESGGKRAPTLLSSPGTAWHAQGRYGALIGQAVPGEARLADCIARFLRESDGQDGNDFCSGAGPVDHLKIVNSGLNSLARFGLQTPPQFPLEQLRAAVDTGRRNSLGTMVHANGEAPVRMAAEAGCASVEHGFFMGPDNLRRLAERQIFWVPTAVTMQAYARQAAGGGRDPDIARRNLERQLEQLRLARHLGVPVAAGTDSGSLGVHHGDSLREEVGLLISAGFPREEALRCATWNGARLLGVEEELGLLGPGRPATFIVVDSPPAALPAGLDRIVAVFFRGERFAIPDGPCIMGAHPNRGAP